MSGLVIPQKTLLDQRRAADPASSAWVSANAGSGKTKVLADRVMRLLLSGAPPERLLCLTFTKAAAANMANRVFASLGRWVSLDDAALTAELAALEGRPPTPAMLDRARQLFARAVETPGGLKIETIHAFCERLLHLFPFEANVPARFEVLDEAASADLLERAHGEVMAAAALGRDPALAAALAILADGASDIGIADAVAAALKQKEFLRQHARGPEGLAAAMRALAAAVGLAPGETRDGIIAAMLNEGLAPQDWPGIAAALRAGSKRDGERGEKLAAAVQAADAAERLALYCEVFFTKEGEPRADSAFVSKSVDATLVARLRDERDRLAALALRRKAADAVWRTQALFTLAAAVFARVEAVKGARGMLDFDDLIAKSVALLQRSEAAWVLYKLDAGIDHVLVDEAQDTSPAQWTILKRLTEEFTAGAGASLRGRTLFAVGDPKQSIYGFQGAAPHEFESSGRHFRNLAAGAELAFEQVGLTLSFRSAPEVLSAVDAVFRDPAHFKGLSFSGEMVGTVHESARPAAPGLVEVWETERPSDAEEPEAWGLPIDEPETTSPPVRLARRIARVVKRWVTTGDERGRRLPAGDILVLVRKRGAFFEAVIRALKNAGVPVAGADRLRLGEHIAVQDLVAAGRAALLPDDDLTLAAALKSPLVGLDDEDLMRIAARRADERSVLEALGEAAAAGDGRAAQALSAVSAWHDLARTEGPFAFYATLLGPRRGRLALVSRLGAEAGDAIDEFLALALAFERGRTPSLAAFLIDFAGAERDVKRDMDAAREEVRVMTVHGAKGLEAPVVILADGCEAPSGRHDPDLIGLAVRDGGRDYVVPVWSGSAKLDPPAVAAERERLRALGAEEHNRLLYVAMTRAKDRLVVASYTNLGRNKDGRFKPLPAMCWSEMVRRSLEAGVPGLAAAQTPEGPVLRWHDAAKTVAPVEVPAVAPAVAVAAPAWLTAPVAAEPERMPPLRPSSALGAADARPRPGDGPFMAEARLVGTLVHALIEHLPALPEAQRPAAAEAFVAARGGRLAAETRRAIVADALAILAAPALAPLFGPSSRAEVPIAGSLPLGAGGEPMPVSGQIDRLAVTDEAVLVVDFKTTARAPAQPNRLRSSHVAQLAVYRALLMQLFPDKPVRAFLVFTSGAAVIELPASDLEAALATLGRA